MFEVGQRVAVDYNNSETLARENLVAFAACRRLDDKSVLHLMYLHGHHAPEIIKGRH